MTIKERKTILLDDLPMFRGDFTWGQADLIRNIKATKPDFNTRDPKTWPRMTSKKLTRLTGGTYYGHEELPFGLAYDSRIASAYIDRRPLRPIPEISFRKDEDGDDVHLNRRFYQFPFIQRVTGLVLPSDDKLDKLRAMELQLGKLTHKSPKVSKASPEVPLIPPQPPQPEKPTSSVEAFNEVLKMMNDIPADNGAEMNALQEEVKELREKLRAQDKRFSNLLAEHKEATELNEEQRAAIKLTTEELRSAKRAHAGLKNATQSIKKKDEQLAEKDQQSRAAKKAAADADERVLKIWAEMKKSKESEQRKRGAGGNASGSEAKKTKLGS
ncbi:hypothetical protein E8E11_003847 [Didymella keratinophila]|nr:hypothetical protein E8E11_003847 [Didymella keratinophila]